MQPAKHRKTLTVHKQAHKEEPPLPQFQHIGKVATSTRCNTVYCGTQREGHGLGQGLGPLRGFTLGGGGGYRTTCKYMHLDINYVSGALGTRLWHIKGIQTNMQGIHHQRSTTTFAYTMKKLQDLSEGQKQVQSASGIQQGPCMSETSPWVEVAGTWMEVAGTWMEVAGT
jgi:hypothetical protein